MAAKQTLTVLDRATLAFIAKSHYSIKTATTDIIGTNKKADVLRVLRTQRLLDYNGAGTAHEIQPAGHRYFVSDGDRRLSNQQLVPHAKLPNIWQEKPGTEVYISGRAALELKRDHFDSRLMALIEPPRQSRRRGLQVEELLAKVDNLDDLPLADGEDVPVQEYLDNDPWMQHAIRMMERGNEQGGRALAYLVQPRTMALLNETGQRAGVNLNRDGREEHLLTFCSYRMRWLMGEDMVFASKAMQAEYLDMVAAMTAEKFLGFSPEAALL